MNKKSFPNHGKRKTVWSWETYGSRSSVVADDEYKLTKVRTSSHTQVSFCTGWIKSIFVWFLVSQPSFIFSIDFLDWLSLYRWGCRLTSLSLNTICGSTTKILDNKTHKRPFSSRNYLFLLSFLIWLSDLIIPTSNATPSPSFSLSKLSDEGTRL